MSLLKKIIEIYFVQLFIGKWSSCMLLNFTWPTFTSIVFRIWSIFYYEHDNGLDSNCSVHVAFFFIHFRCGLTRWHFYRIIYKQIISSFRVFIQKNYNAHYYCSLMLVNLEIGGEISLNRLGIFDCLIIHDLNVDIGTKWQFSIMHIL